MNDYSSWHERLVSVTSLMLDPKNPRIPDQGKEPTQREVASELVEFDNVYGLAKDIAEKGFFPTESLIGFNEGEGRQIIVEGNRRLAALKLLISPELAPDDKIKKFRLLHGRITPDSIKKVRVFFAPSREAAAPLIIARHTQQGVKGWKPAQQAKYLRTLITPGMSLEELSEYLGIPRGQLSDNLRTDTMYQVARTLDLPTDVKALVDDPRAFNASALERLVQSSSAMQFLGVTFDDWGKMTGGIHEDEFKKAYRRMVSDIATGEVDTRKLHAKEQIQDYLQGFGNDAPNRRRRGSFTSDSVLSGAGVAPTETPEPPVKKKLANTRGSAFLMPTSVKCRLKNPRIIEIYGELRRLKVADYTNSVGVLLRIFLELVIGNYLDKTHKIQPLLDTAKTKNKPPEWYPTLRMMLTVILADKDIVLVPLIRKALNKMVSDDNHPLSLDQMDQFVHNRFVGPSEKELRRMWAMLEDLIVQLLNEPVPPPKPAKPGA